MGNQHSISRFRPSFILLATFCTCLLLLINVGPGSTQGFAAQVTLAWDANTDPAVAGYKLYYGYASRTYGTPVDVSKVTRYTLAGIQEGVNCYFAVTAYDASGNESAFSTELECFTLVPAPVVNGSISPSSAVVVSRGMNQTFTVTPASNYAIANVLVDALSAGPVATYTFSNVDRNHSLSASFASVGYSHIISASAGTNGSISPTGSVTVSHGASQAFTITASTGYQVKDVLVDGASVGAVSTYTFSNVTASHTIAATFVAKTYTITASAGTNGSISPTGSVTVSHGASQAFTITASTGYQVKDVLVDGASVGAVASYTFSSVTANHTVSASFALNVSYTIDINPATLRFTSIEGSVPSNQTIAVSISGGGSLSWTAAADSAAPAWLAVSPASGTGNSSLTISVNTTGVLPGTYNKSITITAPGATNTPCVVPVTLVVNAAGTARFNFNYPDRASLVSDGWDFIARTSSGEARDTEQTVGAVVSYDQVAHPGVLRIPADSGDLWTGVNNTRNTLFRDLPADWKSIRLKLASFPPSANYQQAGLVAYQDDDNFVYVTRAYTDENRVSFISESNALYSTISYVSQSVTQNLYLRLDRDATIERISAYYSLDGTNWTSSGDVIQSLTNPRFAIFVGASSGGFPNADFEWVEIESPALTAKIQVSPASLSFSAVSGSSSPSAQTVNLTNSGTTGVLNWTLSNNATWIALTPKVGTTPGSFTVSVNPTGLLPGTYNEEITVSATGATNTPQTIPITLTISPAPLTIMATAGANGAISPSGSVSVNSGASQTFTITPSANYKVSAVTVDGVSVGAVTSYTFSNVTAAHSISASFAVISSTYTIKASAGSGGSISPSGTVLVQNGGSKVFTITPKTYYVVKNVLVDGISVGAVKSYTFSNVQANHTISVTFKYSRTRSSALSLMTADAASSQMTDATAGNLLAGSGSLDGSGGWIEVLNPQGDQAGLPVHIDWPEYNKLSGQLRIATGDIDGDGRDEIIVGLGRVPGAPGIPGGYFAVLDDDHAVIAWGQVEWPQYNQINGETRVACGDIDGDGIAEIVVGLGPGGKGRLEVFKLADRQLEHVKWLQVGWQDYNKGNGETRPACGDLDGDGADEIIVGLGPVKANPDIPGGFFFIFDPTSAGSTDLQDAGKSDVSGWGGIRWPEYNRVNGEIWPACGDVNGDGKDEIVLALGKQGKGRFEIMGFDLPLNSARHIAWQQSLLSSGLEVHPAVGGLDTNAGDDIVIGFVKGGVGIMEVFGNASENFQPLRQVQTRFSAFKELESQLWPAVFRLSNQ